MAQLQSALEQNDHDKSAVEEEVRQLRRHVLEAKAMLEREQAERERFQISSTTVRQLREEARTELDNCSARLRQAEEKLDRAERDSSSLRESSASLRESLAVKEQALVHETQQKVLLEQEVERLRRQQAAARAQANALIAESRSVKGAIRECISHSQALLKVAEDDTKGFRHLILGTDAENKSIVGKRLSVKNANFYESSSDSDENSLLETSATGSGSERSISYDVVELIRLAEALSGLSVWLKALSQERMDLEGNFLLTYICNFNVLSHLQFIYICKLHWNSGYSSIRAGARPPVARTASLADTAGGQGRAHEQRVSSTTDPLSSSLTPACPFIQ